MSRLPRVPPPADASHRSLGSTFPVGRRRPICPSWSSFRHISVPLLPSALFGCSSLPPCSWLLKKPLNKSSSPLSSVMHTPGRHSCEGHRCASGVQAESAPRRESIPSLFLPSTHLFRPSLKLIDESLQVSTFTIRHVNYRFQRTLEQTRHVSVRTNFSPTTSPA